MTADLPALAGSSTKGRIMTITTAFWPAETVGRNRLRAGQLSEPMHALRSWSAFIGETAVHSGKASFFPALTEGLRHWIDFDEIRVFDYRTAGEAEIAFHDLAPSRKRLMIDAYLAGEYRQDPLFLACAKSHPGLLRCETSRARDTAGGYYLRHLRHSRLREEIGFAAPAIAAGRLILRIARLEGSAAFQPEELEFCAAIEPALGALLAAHAARVEQGRHSPSDPTGQNDGPALGQVDLGGLGISPREIDVVGLIMQGHCNSTIADLLGISHGTVKIHRKNIYRKLEISSQAELFNLVFATCPPRAGNRGQRM